MNNSEYDGFEKQLFEKGNDFSLPLPPNGWDRLDAALSRRRIRLGWILFPAVAALLTGLFVYFNSGSSIQAQKSIHYTFNFNLPATAKTPVQEQKAEIVKKDIAYPRTPVKKDNVFPAIKEEVPAWSMGKTRIEEQHLDQASPMIPAFNEQPVSDIQTVAVAHRPALKIHHPRTNTMVGLSFMGGYSNRSTDYNSTLQKPALTNSKSYYDSATIKQPPVPGFSASAFLMKELTPRKSITVAASFTAYNYSVTRRVIPPSSYYQGAGTRVVTYMVGTEEIVQNKYRSLGLDILYSYKLVSKKHFAIAPGLGIGAGIPVFSQVNIANLNTGTYFMNKYYLSPVIFTSVTGISFSYQTPGMYFSLSPQMKYTLNSTYNKDYYPVKEHLHLVGLQAGAAIFINK